MILEWTIEAIEDVESHRSYIASFNARAADQVAAAINRAAARLSRHPELGRPLPGLEARLLLETRFRYKLVYEVEADADVVRILRVFHPRRNLP